MFTVVTDRQNKIHLLNIKSGSTYYTYCGATCTKNTYPNTLAVNQPPKNICPHCIEIFNLIFKYNKDYPLRVHKPIIYRGYHASVKFGWDDASILYRGYIARHWRKLDIYIGKTNRGILKHAKRANKYK
jgi:hypothetical protein